MSDAVDFVVSTFVQDFINNSANIELTTVSSTVNDLSAEPQNTVNSSSYPELCEVNSIIDGVSEEAQSFINTLTNSGSSHISRTGNCVLESQNSINNSETFLSSTLNDESLCFTNLNEKDELISEEKVNTNTHKVKKGPIKILKRLCFICGKSFRRLSRHIAKKHKTNEKVKTALQKPKIERNRLFQSFKKDGIRNFNLKQIDLKVPRFERERSQRKCESLVMCSLCHGFYSKSYYSRHMNVCGKDSSHSKCAVPVEILTDKSQEGLSQNFKTEILQVIRDDPIGITVKSDRTILMIGSLLYEKVRRKLSKKSEVQNSVRNDMRRLGHLYSHFKNYEVKPIYCNAADMFLRQNFSSLKLAIEVYTDTYSENQKSGLKAALYYLISSSAKKCVGSFLAQDDDSAKSISDFLVLLQLRKEEIFGDATYDLNERRNISLKKPSKLPIESDIQMIRDLHAYVELRDAACTRLVLFNGRRGGEPARLLLREWFEAAKDAWLDEQRAEDLTEINETNMKITYQSGKGSNHLVPVLIPEDTVRAMEILSDPVVRSNVGVLESNVYVFPSCQSSEKHCSGWHSLTNVCDKLPIINKSRLTGTTNRHRLSTLMAAINLSDLEKSLVFKHFGHSKNINENIYQAPAAHQQILSTGKHLLAIDAGIK
ncbi:uncharacterized protein LOC136071695 [Hydra vulgaris]|uniref:uncharacterized protein LOC136071695 n=1 Tax=Hydra vulgaris TaxID=6087 RepID=UPI0032EA2FEF